MNRTMCMLLVAMSLTASAAAAHGMAGFSQASGTENIHHTERHNPFHLSIRSNALYDVALVPNVGVELSLGRNFSIGINAACAWWSKTDEMKFWRIAGGELYGRRYFGRPAAEGASPRGHHAGIYAQLFRYEIAFGKSHTGQQSDLSYGIGIEYGYTLPLGSHFNIDFTLGIGYIGGKYEKYVSSDTHRVWQSTSRRNWTGPTKAEVAIVWLLGKGNQNARKGGGR